MVTRLRADGGDQGPKLAATLREMGGADVVEIVDKPKESKGFTVLHRRSRGGADLCLAKDFGRTLESSLAWARLAACRFLVRRIALEKTA